MLSETDTAVRSCQIDLTASQAHFLLMAQRARRLLYKRLGLQLCWPFAAVMIVLARSPAHASTDPNQVSASAQTRQIDSPIKITVSRAVDLIGSSIPVRRATVSGVTIVDLTGRRAIRILSGPNSELVDAAQRSLGRQPVKGILTSRFGLRWHPMLGGYRQHSGIDLAAPSGTPVRATSAGRIAAAGWQGGYGLLVAVDHGKSAQSRYGHLSRITVAPGEEVNAGDVIGYVGTTGLSTGPHLHYELRVGGVAVNPGP